MPPDISHTHLHKHVDKGLLWRLYIYFGLSVLILSAIIYRMIVTPGGFLFALLALVAGVIIGTLVSRMYKMSWDKKARKIIFQVDIYGFLILAAYVAFEILGERYIHESFQGAQVFTIILSLAGGAMFGRGVGMTKNIARLLDKHI